MGKGKGKNKRKSKVSMGKTLADAMRNCNSHISSDNIIEKKSRTQKKNYNDGNKKQPKPEYSTINFEAFVKSYQKNEDIENLLISSVKSSGMLGVYKYY